MKTLKTFTLSRGLEVNARERVFRALGIDMRRISFGFRQPGKQVDADGYVRTMRGSEFFRPFRNKTFRRACCKAGVGETDNIATSSNS